MFNKSGFIKLKEKIYISISSMKLKNKDKKYSINLIKIMLIYYF